jgi:hypothetical protein
MPLVTRSARASIDPVQSMYHQTLAGNAIAAEAIPAVCACKMNANGTVGIAAATDAIIGVTAIDALAGEPVTLFGAQARAKYSDGGLTPGALLYIGAGGVLDTTAAGAPLALALSASDILIVRAV